MPIKCHGASIHNKVEIAFSNVAIGTFIFRTGATITKLVKAMAHFIGPAQAQAELDFVLQFNDAIFSIEVKSSASMKKNSLTTYTQKYKPGLAIKTSSMNLKLDGRILNCPLYLFGKIASLLTTISAIRR